MTPTPEKNRVLEISNHLIVEQGGRKNSSQSAESLPL